MNAVDVVKYEASERELVGKFASDGIRLGSQLVVYPGQTAFFVKGGKIYDAYTGGTYTLKTENIPLLDKVLNKPFGGDTPFAAEVWFVNQLSLPGCKWGTAAPLQIEDPKYKVIVPLRAFGQYGFHIDDPRLFLERLVGNMPSFATDKVEEYFRSVILSKLTNILYDKLKEEGLSVLNINAHIESLSDYAGQRLAEEFSRYGLAIELFRIGNISVKEDDPSFKLLKEAKDAAARIRIMGRDNYQMERSFNVLEKAAANEGGAVGAAMGLGTGFGFGGQAGQMAAHTMNPYPDAVPPMPTMNYYLAIGGTRQEGPMTREAVVTKIKSGETGESCLVWKKGMSDWQRLKEAEEFRSLFENDCPPPLPTL